MAERLLWYRLVIRSSLGGWQSCGVLLGALSFSFQAEVCALRVRFEWLMEHGSEWSRVVIVSDSQCVEGCCIRTVVSQDRVRC